MILFTDCTNENWVSFVGKTDFPVIFITFLRESVIASRTSYLPRLLYLSLGRARFFRALRISSSKKEKSKKQKKYIKQLQVYLLNLLGEFTCRRQDQGLCFSCLLAIRKITLQVYTKKLISCYMMNRLLNNYITLHLHRSVAIA